MYKKPIIVFEGIEGTGKSYHIKNVTNFLKKKKIKFIKKDIKNFLNNMQVDSYDWLLNIWSPLIYKIKILKKIKKNLNLHPSYLPFAKGKDPYVWSVEKQFPIGVTIHEMNNKIDYGKVFVQKKITGNWKRHIPLI